MTTECAPARSENAQRTSKAIPICQRTLINLAPPALMFRPYEDNYLL